MKKELYSIPKAVTAVYFDGHNLEEIQDIAPKAISEVVAIEQLFITRAILNGDVTDKYDNIIYPGQWVIAKSYPRSKYHKEDGVDTTWFEIVDNLDNYIETNKVIINN